MNIIEEYQVGKRDFRRADLSDADLSALTASSAVRRWLLEAGVRA